MNATELMADQHDAIEDLFRSVDRADPRDTAKLRALALRLAAHMRIEEEILFPVARTTRGDVGERTVSAHVLRRMTAADGDHAKVAKVVELAEAHLATGDDVSSQAMDLDLLEDIGDSLATMFEDGVRASNRAARTRRRPVERPSTMRSAARRSR
ncbi:MAG: hemerythrin domain-containing protein [Myxococcota bacterium]|nr:hemerythrin domain-containing protein [Myxococcota bacterium]